MQFSQAIESGKTEDEARHIAAIATLNSNTFIEFYMEPWGNSSIFPDVGYMSPEFIIGEVFNDGKFTLEDFYSAEKFWWKICKYKNAKGLDACATAKEHWVEKHCGRSDVIKSFCSGSGRRLRASEQCLVRNKSVINVSEEEKTKNKA